MFLQISVLGRELSLGLQMSSAFPVLSCYMPEDNMSYGASALHRPLSRRLDRCERIIQNEPGDRTRNGSNVYYVTMQITFLTCKFRNVKRNLHCDVVHITPVWVSGLTLDCNGVFAIKTNESKLQSLKCYLRVGK